MRKNSIKCVPSFHAKKPSLTSDGSHTREVIPVWFILNLNFFIMILFLRVVRNEASEGICLQSELGLVCTF